MIIAAGYANYKTYHMPCPADPDLGRECLKTRRRSRVLYYFSTLIFIFFFITVIRIPAGILILIWFATQLINANLTDPNSPGVAWFAHIGGFLMGILLLPFLKKKNIKYFAYGNKHGLIQKNIRLRFRK